METVNPAPGAGVALVAPPTSPSERIFALDVIRGFAVLGILLMNIVGFGLTGPAYTSATAEVGGADGLNHWAWLAQMLATPSPSPSRARRSTAEGMNCG